MRSIKIDDLKTFSLPRFDNLKVVVAEDDWLVSMALQDILSDMGCDVVGAASEAASALELVEQSTIDVAILDYWLHDKAIDPVADALLAKGIPFVLATGFGVGDISPRLRHVPLLTKPYIVDDVAEALAQLVARPPPVAAHGPVAMGQLVS